jgi:nucleoid DNA-binding protein
MTKDTMAQKLAKQLNVPKSKAADEIDGIVHKILAGLRQGKEVSVPGLGRFEPGPKPSFRPEGKENGKPGAKYGK